MSEFSKEVLKAYEMAKEARLRSYSPYSNFKVGAAIKVKNEDLICSAHNIENICFPAGNCAESVALYSAISQHGKKEYEFIVVVADTKNPTAPCGICRQVLSEHAGADFPIYLANLEKIVEKTTLGTLLPLSFNALK